MLYAVVRKVSYLVSYLVSYSAQTVTILFSDVISASVDDFECPDDLNEAVGHILQEVLTDDENGSSDCLDEVCSGLFHIIKK